MNASLVFSVCLSSSVVFACGDNVGSELPADAAPADSSAACPIGPTITRSQFVEQSVTYLHTAFGVTAGFDAGTVAYGEGWVSLGDGGCPLADWTTLSYVAPIEPALVPIELRATHARVAAVWAMNGRRFIAYLPAVGGDAAPWWQGAMPDNVIAVAKPNAAQPQIDQLVAELATDQPTVRVVWLDAIGILTLETTIGNFAFDDAATGRIPNIEAATEAVRASGLFESVAWSGFVVRIPNESYPAVVVEGDELSPECLRTETRTKRDDNLFSTIPALPAPLGAGPTENPNVCPE